MLCVFCLIVLWGFALFLSIRVLRLCRHIYIVRESMVPSEHRRNAQLSCTYTASHATVACGDFNYLRCVIPHIGLRYKVDDSRRV